MTMPVTYIKTDKNFYPGEEFESSEVASFNKYTNLCPLLFVVVSVTHNFGYFQFFMKFARDIRLSSINLISLQI